MSFWKLPGVGILAPRFNMLRDPVRGSFGASRGPGTREPFWKLISGQDTYACELLDAGVWGVEAQIYHNRAFLYSRRFDTRALAMEWARLELDRPEREF